MRYGRHALVAGLMLVTVGMPVALAQEKAPAGGHSKAQIGTWGFDLAGMDTSVDPSDDFYRYAAGAWLKNTKIPADRSSWESFGALAVKAEEDIKHLLEQLASSTQAPGSIEQKVADVYTSYLDTKKLNELGLKPFQADLALIKGLKTHEDVAKAIGSPGLSAKSPIATGPILDAKDPDRYTIIVAQAGLGLPNRDYYLGEQPAFVQVRSKYRDYIEQMLTLADVPDAKASATAIAELEKRIAEMHWPLEKQRNKDLTYNPMSRSELKAFAPKFPWDAALGSAGLAAQDRFVVREKDAIAHLAELFGTTPVPTWRAYLTFHYLNSQADIMPAAFDEANFAFFGKVLNGQPQQRERWKRAIDDVNGFMGMGPLAEAVGQLYVKKINFSPEAKAAVKQLVDNFLSAYQKRIASLEWMSPETRQVAIRKAQTVRVKIGYPDRWKEYSALTIEPGDAYGNRKRLNIFEWNRLVSRMGEKTDKDEWGMAPQTINAYYKAEFNEIAFPASILQPPFFDPNADPAVNYGAVGGVIGHEMGHGYDDQGAKSDENGVLRTWWKHEDEVRFQALTKKLAAQYSSFSPLPGLHVNGDFTSGENIGDLGGLSVAYAAYQISLGGKPAPVLDGFTGEQRFFLGWAQLWRGLYRDEFLRRIVTSDIHAPNEYRVNVVLRNIDAWYDAFDVKPQEKLYLKPEERVRIW